MDRELRFVVEEKRTVMDLLTLWVPRIVLALFFAVIGYTKFDGNPKGMWFQLFEKIGFGQWFRLFTGGMQITGALLLLHRRTIDVGAVMLAATMVGAAIVDAFVQRQAIFAIIPLILLGFIVVVWYAARFGVAADRD